MSNRGYYLRRGDQIFEGASWEQLCEWATQGRIKPSDRFMTPESSKWRDVEREPTLLSLIPHRERIILRRGDHTYKASGYEMIQIWAAKGQVSPDDQVYSSYTQLWTSVRDLPSIMEHIPKIVLDKTEALHKRRQVLAHLQIQDVEESRSSSLSDDHFSLESESYEDSPSSNEHHLQATEMITPVHKPSESSIKEIIAPIYDSARLFISVKEMRPLDRIKGECFLSSLNLDCQGMNKREALSGLSKQLGNHVKSYFPDEISARSIGAIDVYFSIKDFLAALDDGLENIGKVEEERFVVGNHNRPKLSAEESSLMIYLHSCIEQMISAVRAFKQ